MALVESAHMYWDQTRIVNTNIDHFSKLPTGSRVRMISRDVTSLLLIPWSSVGAFSLISSLRCSRVYHQPSMEHPVSLRRSLVDLPSAARVALQSRGRSTSPRSRSSLSEQAALSWRFYISCLEASNKDWTLPSAASQSSFWLTGIDQKMGYLALLLGGLRFRRSSANVLTVPYQAF